MEWICSCRYYWSRGGGVGEWALLVEVCWVEGGAVIVVVVVGRYDDVRRRRIGSAGIDRG